MLSDFLFQIILVFCCLSSNSFSPSPVKHLDRSLHLNPTFTAQSTSMVFNSKATLILLEVVLHKWKKNSIHNVIHIHISTLYSTIPHDKL